jgi:hypothetical protein
MAEGEINWDKEWAKLTIEEEAKKVWDELARYNGLPEELRNTTYETVAQAKKMTTIAPARRRRTRVRDPNREPLPRGRPKKNDDQSKYQQMPKQEEATPTSFPPTHTPNPPKTSKTSERPSVQAGAGTIFQPRGASEPIAISSRASDESEGSEEDIPDTRRTKIIETPASARGVYLATPTTEKNQFKTRPLARTIMDVGRADTIETIYHDLKVLYNNLTRDCEEAFGKVAGAYEEGDREEILRAGWEFQDVVVPGLQAAIRYQPNYDRATGTLKRKREDQS